MAQVVGAVFGVGEEVFTVGEAADAHSLEGVVEVRFVNDAEAELYGGAVHYIFALHSVLLFCGLYEFAVYRRYGEGFVHVLASGVGLEVVVEV